MFQVFTELEKTELLKKDKNKNKPGEKKTPKINS